jgi:hypothetical protein
MTPQSVKTACATIDHGSADHRSRSGSGLATASGGQDRCRSVFDPSVDLFYKSLQTLL